MKMKSKSDIVFDIINYIILTIVFLIAFYPLYFVVIASFSHPKYVTAGETLFFIKGFTLDGYNTMFQNEIIWSGYKNSAIYTLVGTIINLCVLIPASFALSRKELVGRKFFTAAMLFCMYFSGGAVPLYMVVKNLGLMDSIWSLVLPGAFSVYNMIICRSFFSSNVSEELYESVKIDGGGYATFFFRIVLPLSKSIIAVMVLYHALGHWNSYLSALYYISDTKKYPLQVVLQEITSTLTPQGAESMSQGTVKGQNVVQLVKYTTIIIAALPMIILYPFVQKHFVSGVMIGSVKG